MVHSCGARMIFLVLLSTSGFQPKDTTKALLFLRKVFTTLALVSSLLGSPCVDQVHPFGLVIPGKVGFRLKVLESINQSRGRQVLFSRVEVISGVAKHYTENVANQVLLEYTKIEMDPDKIKMNSLPYNPG